VPRITCNVADIAVYGLARIDNLIQIDGRGSARIVLGYVAPFVDSSELEMDISRHVGYDLKYLPHANWITSICLYCRQPSPQRLSITQIVMATSE
jgi:hypothetical protein